MQPITDAAMRLFFRVPVFTEAGKDEVETRLGDLRVWIEGGGGRELRDRYGFSGINYRGLAPGQHLKLHSEDEDPVLILYPPKENALVPKGVLIRLEVIAALEYVDRTNPNDRDDALFVMIDGSGAFKFSNIFAILDPLFTVPRCDVVLGQRPRDNVGMPTWRQNIEAFEEFLLLRKFDDRVRGLITVEKRLPDSQAGAWGLRLSALKSLPLTARKYGLEFDLAASTLESNLRVAFSKELEMDKRRASEFGETINGKGIENSLRKLRFIQHKLDMTLEEVVESLMEYKTLSETTQWPQLPERYIQGVEGLLP